MSFINQYISLEDYIAEGDESGAYDQTQEELQELESTMVQDQSDIEEGLDHIENIQNTVAAVESMSDMLSVQAKRSMRYTALVALGMKPETSIESIAIEEDTDEQTAQAADKEEEKGFFKRMWEAIKKFFKAIWDKIKSFFKAIANFFTGKEKNMEKKVEDIKKNTEEIKNTVGEPLADAVTEVAQTIAEEAEEEIPEPVTPVKTAEDVVIEAPPRPKVNKEKIKKKVKDKPKTTKAVRKAVMKFPDVAKARGIEKVTKLNPEKVIDTAVTIVKEVADAQGSIEDLCQMSMISLYNRTMADEMKRLFTNNTELKKTIIEPIQKYEEVVKRVQAAEKGQPLQIKVMRVPQKDFQQIESIEDVEKFYKIKYINTLFVEKKSKDSIPDNISKLAGHAVEIAANARKGVEAWKAIRQQVVALAKEYDNFDLKMFDINEEKAETMPVSFDDIDKKEKIIGKNFNQDIRKYCQTSGRIYYQQVTFSIRIIRAIEKAMTIFIDSCERVSKAMVDLAK